MIFDPRDWLWIVGNDETRLYASATNTWVTPDDEAHAAFVAAGGRPSRIASEAELAHVLRTQAPGLIPAWLLGASTFVQPAAGAYTPDQLAAYAADARWRRETAGITVSGAAVATDRESQAMLSGAWAYVQQNPAATIRWKAADGFVTLDAAAVTALAVAVGAHVQACFATEADVIEMIRAEPPTIGTLAEIDDAFATI